MSLLTDELTVFTNDPHRAGAPDPVLFDENLVASYGRMLEAACDEDCELHCATAVSEDDRRMAYERFCGLATDARVAQNAHLCACVELKQRAVDTDADIIEQTAEFWLGDSIKVKVCRTFFASTLGLPGARLDALLEPETLRWYERELLDAAGGQDCDDDRMRRQDDAEEPCTDFVLNSRSVFQ